MQAQKEFLSKKFVYLKEKLFPHFAIDYMKIFPPEQFADKNKSMPFRVA